MQMQYLLLVGLLGVPGALAHMHLKFPPPLRGEQNQYRDKTKEYSLKAEDNPLKKDGSDYPCRGYKSLIGTKEGTPVATWTAGSKQVFELAGQSPHYGGSCQISLSYDKGNSFHVIMSFPGSCPRRRATDSQKFDFTLPADAPAGKEVVFAWSWHNREREMYMSCAVITVENKDAAASLTEFTKRPLIFTADIGGDCETLPGNGFELLYPDPGQAVLKGDEKEYKLKGPICKSKGGAGGATTGGGANTGGTPGNTADKKAGGEKPASTGNQSPVTPDTGTGGSYNQRPKDVEKTDGEGKGKGKGKGNKGHDKGNKGNKEQVSKTKSDGESKPTTTNKTATATIPSKTPSPAAIRRRSQQTNARRG